MFAFYVITSEISVLTEKRVEQRRPKYHKTLNLCRKRS